MSRQEGIGSPHPTLKPRPRLFAVLCVLFGVWLTALSLLYWKTVYPLRHPPAPRPQDNPAAWR